MGSVCTPRWRRCVGQVQLMRTDDGGETWVHAPVDDPRPEARIGGGDVPVPKVDPKDPNTVYVASVVTWKSTDAGKDVDGASRRSRRGTTTRMSGSIQTTRTSWRWRATKG